MIEFPPFRLDLIAGRLWRGDHPVTLRPKAWTLLCFLAERPGVLVTKDDLHKAVWGDTVVSDATLTQTLGELRHALHDDPKMPRLIETVHGRGVRFIARIEALGDDGLTPGAAFGPDSTPGLEAHAGVLVGRDAEIARLQALFRQAAAGHRQVVVIQGEPGMGKTSLVEVFLHGLRAAPDGALVGYAQCVEQVGHREPYMPVLEALERMSHGPGHERLLTVLRQVAPSWLAHMPALHAPGERPPLGKSGMAPNRMPREFANLVEAISVDHPLVLVLEDLHWSDESTVDLVSIVAQRPERARVMLVVTYRPAEAAALNHALGGMLTTLRARRLCTDIALEYLSRHDIHDYLQHRFPGAGVAEDTTFAIHDHTDGNPLFMVALVDHLLARGWLAMDGGVWKLTAPPAAIAREVPTNLMELIQGQLRFVSPAEADVLEVASVVGVTFDTPAVGAALDRAPDEVDGLCSGLCRSGKWLRPLGNREWPDGSLAGRYAFAHALYQRTLYERLRPSRRAALHQRIGERLETGYPGRMGEVSPDLARHFERSGDRRRAVRYLEQAARRGQERGAYRDVVACLDLALGLLRDLPETPERYREELELRQRYGAALAQTAGYAAEALHENLMRSRHLSEQLGDTGALFDTLYALGYLHSTRGEYTEAERIGGQLAEMSKRLDASAVLRSEYTQGTLALWAGSLGAAEPLLGRVVSSPVSLDDASRLYGVSPLIGGRSFEGLRRWVAGDAEGARAIQREALALAERLGRPFSLAQALTLHAFVLLLDAQWGEAAALASRAVDLSDEYGFPLWLGAAHVCRGRASVEAGVGDLGLVEIREGLEMLRQVELRMGGSLLFSFLAGASLRLNRPDEGLAATDAGLAHCRDTAEGLFEAELWRLRGECLLRWVGGTAPTAAAGIEEAAQCFAKAQAVARAQGALMLERRACRREAVVAEIQPPPD